MADLSQFTPIRPGWGIEEQPAPTPTLPNWQGDVVPPEVLYTPPPKVDVDPMTGFTQESFGRFSQDVAKLREQWTEPTQEQLDANIDQPWMSPSTLMGIYPEAGWKAPDDGALTIDEYGRMDFSSKYNFAKRYDMPMASDAELAGGLLHQGRGQMLQGLANMELYTSKLATMPFNPDQVDNPDQPGTLGFWEGFRALMNIEPMLWEGLSREGKKYTEASEVEGQEFMDGVRGDIIKGVNSFYYTAPSVLAGGLLKSPVMAASLLGFSSGGGAYLKYKDKGYPDDIAMFLGGVEGTIEGGTEMLPMEFLFAKWGKNWAAGLAKYVFAQTGQEVLAESAQAALEKVTIEKDMTWDQFKDRMGGMLRSLPYSLGLTAVMGKTTQAVTTPGQTLDAARAWFYEREGADSARDRASKAAGHEMMRQMKGVSITPADELEIGRSMDMASWKLPIAGGRTNMMDLLKGEDYTMAEAGVQLTGAENVDRIMRSIAGDEAVPLDPAMTSTRAGRAGPPAPPGIMQGYAEGLASYAAEPQAPSDFQLHQSGKIEGLFEEMQTLAPVMGAMETMKSLDPVMLNVAAVQATGQALGELSPEMVEALSQAQADLNRPINQRGALNDNNGMVYRVTPPTPQNPGYTVNVQELGGYVDGRVRYYEEDELTDDIATFPTDSAARIFMHLVANQRQTFEQEIKDRSQQAQQLLGAQNIKVGGTRLMPFSYPISPDQVAGNLVNEAFADQVRTGRTPNINTAIQTAMKADTPGMNNRVREVLADWAGQEKVATFGDQRIEAGPMAVPRETLPRREVVKSDYILEAYRDIGAGAYIPADVVDEKIIVERRTPDWRLAFNISWDYMTPEVHDLISASVNRIVAAGFPEELAEELTYVVGSKHEKNGREAGVMALYPTIATVVIREDIMAEVLNNQGQAHVQQFFDTTMAHELGHYLDMGFEDKPASLTSLSLTLDVFQINITPERRVEIGDDAMGSVMLEALQAYYENDLLRRFLHYPFNSFEVAVRDSRRDLQEHIQRELFAQLSGLYYTHRDFLREQLPLAYNMMESIDGDLANAGIGKPVDKIPGQVRGGDFYGGLTSVPGYRSEDPGGAGLGGARLTVGERGGVGRAPGSSIPILTGEEAPTLTGTGPHGKVTNKDVGQYLDQRAKELGMSLDMDDFSDEAADQIATVLSDEALFQLARDDSALGWYEATVSLALTYLQIKHPELKTDRDAEMVFKMITAITSNGIKVKKNLELANEAYTAYKKTGKIPMVGIGMRRGDINNSLALLNNLIEHAGFDNLREFLKTSYTVRELRAMGLPVSGENVDTVVTGAVGMGAKIGSFYGNMNGIYTSLTMDLWWTRTVNRVRGTMFEPFNKQTLVDGRARIRKLINDGEAPGFTGKYGSDRSIDAYAKKMFKAYAKTDFTDKTQANLAGKAHAMNLQRSKGEILQNDPRTGNERNFMRAIAAKIHAKMGDQAVVTADLQALLWYHEKSVFAILKGERSIEDEQAQEDYATAAYALLTPEERVTAGPYIKPTGGRGHGRDAGQHAQVTPQEALKNYNMTVTHGSGALFDKFDLKFVGSGEGAQSNSWGIYLAEHGGVGGGYAASVGSKFWNVRDDTMVNGDKLDDFLATLPPAEKKVAQAVIEMHVESISRRWNDQEDMEFGSNYVESLNEYLRSYDPEEYELYDEDGNEFKGDPAAAKRVADKIKSVVTSEQGNVYEVDIADEVVARLMDWDDTMDNQPESVIEGLMAEDLVFEDDETGELHFGTLAQNEPLNNITGEEVYDAIVQDLQSGHMMHGIWGVAQAEDRGGWGRGFTEATKEAEKSASLFLASIGIPGVKYLDAKSRKKGEGTRNYVIYDTAVLNIISINGERVYLPREDARYYHGGPGTEDVTLHAPAFLTTDSEGAQWFADNRGGDVAEYDVTTRYPLNIDTREGSKELVNIARAAGVPVEITGDIDKGTWEFHAPTIAKHSFYDGTNMADLMYIPAVREEMKRRGYDSLTLQDPLSNDFIETIVVLDPKKHARKIFDMDSVIKNQDGSPKVFHRAMSDKGLRPHPSTGMIHVASDESVADEFATQGRSVNQFYVVADQPFDYRIPFYRDWLVSELTKPENLAQFNKETKEIMESGPGSVEYTYVADAGDIEAGVWDGQYQIMEVPMVTNMIRNRGYLGHDAIYMKEDLQSGEPNLAVFSPDQLVPVLSAHAMTLPGKIDLSDTKIVDEKGNPQIVYRGEHGERKEDINTRERLPTFTPEHLVAQDYASDLEGGFVGMYYLNITNPIDLDQLEDVISMGQVREILGEIKPGEEELLLQLVQFPYNWRGWPGGLIDNPETFYEDDARHTMTPEKIPDEGYTDSFEIADSPAFVQLMKNRGYDGIIIRGVFNAEDAMGVMPDWTYEEYELGGVIEYRPFSQDQIVHAYQQDAALPSHKAEYSGKAFRVEGLNGGAPPGLSAADIVREEISRGKEIGPGILPMLEGVDGDMLRWVTRTKEAMMEEYGPDPVSGYAGMVQEDEIFEVTDEVKGSRVLYEDDTGALLLMTQLPSFWSEVAGTDIDHFLSTLNSNEKAQELLKKVITDQESVMFDARRGKMTIEEIQERAAQLGWTEREMNKIPRGSGVSPEEFEAGRTIVDSALTRLQELAEVAAGGNDQAVMDFEAALSQFTPLAETMLGMRAEWGRVGVMMQQQASQHEQIKHILEGMGGADVGQAKAAVLADLAARGAKPDEIARTAKKLAKTRKIDMALEVWYAFLLSGLRTHAVNSTSNFMVALWTLPETLMAAMIGKTHGGDKVYFREATARAIGMINGMRDGMMLANEIIREEMPMGKYIASNLNKVLGIPDPVEIGPPEERRAFIDATKDQLEAALGQKMEGQPRMKRIPGKLGVGIRAPLTMLSVEDAVFQMTGQRMELYAQATRQAIKEEVPNVNERAQAIADAVDNLIGVDRPQIKDMTPEEEMLWQIFDDSWAGGKYQTFTNELGARGSKATRWMNEFPMPARLIVPFVRTPTNIVKFFGHRTPLAVAMPSFWAMYNRGGAYRDIAIARVLFGSGVMATVFTLGLAGKITGGGPSDDERNERRIWRQKYTPYAMKFGDDYYSFNRLEPIGMLFGVSADMAYLWNRADDAEKGDLFNLIHASILRNLLSKTWLTGLSEAINVVYEPSRYGKRVFGRLFATTIPTLVGNIASVNDPYMREINTLLDSFTAKIPGLRDTLEIRHNLWGQPIQYGGILGPDLVSFIYMGEDPHDPVVDELIRLEYFPGMPGKKINGVELTRQQYNEFVRLRGIPAKNALNRMVGTNTWNMMSDWRKIQFIKNDIFGIFDDLARDEMARRYPEIPSDTEQTNLRDIERAQDDIQQLRGYNRGGSQEPPFTLR